MTNWKTAPRIGACLIALFASGCAVNGHSFLKRSAPVKIATNPAGAVATSEYGDSCVTPCSLRLLMSRGGDITITKEGYEPYIAEIGSSVSKTKAFFGSTADAAYYLDDPDIATFAIDAVDNLVNADSKYKSLDAYSIAVRLMPIGETLQQEAAPLIDDNGVVLIAPREKS